METKVVVTGSPRLYHLLYLNDPDFAHIFKIKADFGDEMARTAAHQASYAHLIARLCREENLPHFDRSGVEAVIEAGMRRVGDQEKLASQFHRLADLCAKRVIWRRRTGLALSAAHTSKRRLRPRNFRTNRLEEKIQRPRLPRALF